MTDDEHEDDSPQAPGFDEELDGLTTGGADPTTPTVGTRLASSLIDAIVAFVLLYIVGFVLVVALVHPAKGQKLTQSQTLTIALATSIVAALLFAVMEHSGGTLGRRLMHVRLVNLDRTLPGWSGLIVRYLAVFIPLISIIGALLVVGAIMVAIGQGQRRDGFDLLSRTRVVPTGYVRGPSPSQL